ncbi:PREDICTED: zinc finger A20 and AN1 domain-containing stress-associated protein 4-like isoform X1 [Camelina sativa]|uniref:Zinc finger A20 and AN1 domain-containing stress-associated protein 4-like isoform X1 n=1 Tax=Camelina sativa TaxID=90675 RepID=A0ABM0YSB6_CAMSA|nr:PREDICTED: zinc finger A20 and AN1 domain-containing stress-associated protein 4-like isoform X1 [Camelina sativa]
MAEEHRCETPEGHRLCVNNCGFFGSSTTMNLCSNCYGDLCLKQQQQASMISTVESSLSPPPLVIAPVLHDNYAAELDITIPKKTEEKKTIETSTESHQNQQQQRPNRCTVCRKRVGLTGFMCRCGTTFCGSHRYPEVHGCTFDFKSAGREEIKKANPLVVAAKLQKI